MASAEHTSKHATSGVSLAPANDLKPGTHPLRGAMLFVLALLIFACMDTTTKYLTTHYNVPLVMAMRYIVHLLLMLAILAPSQGAKLVATNRTGLVLLRAGSLAITSLFVGLALSRMPVAETTAILFLSPMLVMLLARPLLGERIGIVGWTAAAAGFMGVLMIARPGGGLDTLGIVFALCSVGAGACYQLMSRTLATTEQTMPLLFFTALVGSVCFGASLPWFWEGDAPTPLQAVLFVCMGAAGALGHFLFTAAFRDTEASVLAPMNYLQLVWAGLLGWLVFDHVPDHLSVAGMLVVAASGLMIAFKSRWQKAK